MPFASKTLFAPHIYSHFFKCKKKTTVARLNEPVEAVRRQFVAALPDVFARLVNHMRRAAELRRCYFVRRTHDTDDGNTEV